MAPKKFHISLETQVLLGLVLGLAAGVFFGEMVAFTRIAGDAFIKLLQITVIPYIIVSLITALGRLSYDEVKSLGLKAGGVLLILWGVGLVVVFLAPLRRGFAHPVGGGSCGGLFGAAQFSKLAICQLLQYQPGRNGEAR